MTSQYEVPPHTYRFPYRINMPLLILFWDAKQLGITFVTIASGNIFDFFITSVVVAVVFWFAYKKAAEEGVRGKLKHKLWWFGLFRGNQCLVVVTLPIHLSETSILDGAKNETSQQA